MRRLELVVIAILLLTSTGCGGGPFRAVHTGRDEGYLRFVGGRPGQTVYVDGVQRGSAEEFNGKPGILATTSGLRTRLYYWGQYEDSLHTRVTDASPEGRQKAFRMLEQTIQAAEQAGQRVPPGVYADYGYQGNRPDEAVRYLRKEVELYPEAKPLMDSIISRIVQQQTKP